LSERELPNFVKGASKDLDLDLKVVDALIHKV
jgi:hypothetical protein